MCPQKVPLETGQRGIKYSKIKSSVKAIQKSKQVICAQSCQRVFHMMHCTVGLTLSKVLVLDYSITWYQIVS